MNISKRIIESPIICDPWNYKIVDNFFEQEIFDSFKESLPTLLKKYGSNDINTGVLNFTHLKSGIHDDTKNYILSHNLDILTNIDTILDSFPKSRRGKRYKSVVNFTILKSQLGDFEIHDESPEKALSIVIYLYPKNSVGTKMYSSKNKVSFRHEIEWKQNRAMIFCGCEKETWHSFGTRHDPRITLNFFYKILT